MREEMNWLMPAAFILAMEYLAVWMIGSRFDFPYDVAIFPYLVLGAVVSIGILLFLLLVQLALFARRDIEHPLAALKDAARENGARLVALNAGIMFVALQMGALLWSKSMIPYVSDMWADPMLAQIDRSIFGTDPWKLTHAAIGRADFIDRAYIAWSPVKFATLLVLFALPPSRPRTKCIIAYFLLLSTGCLLQFALPSGGPIFYELLGHGQDFADLPYPHFARVAAGYLWANHLGTGAIGTGISAMPSMHVAVALWIALSAWAFDRRIGLLGFAFFGVIAIGSVHTGWHYAVDGFAGSVLALVCWLLAPMVIRLLNNRSDLRTAPARA